MCYPFYRGGNVVIVHLRWNALHKHGGKQSGDVNWSIITKPHPSCTQEAWLWLWSIRNLMPYLTILIFESLRNATPRHCPWSLINLKGSLYEEAQSDKVSKCKSPWQQRRLCKCTTYMQTLARLINSSGSTKNGLKNGDYNTDPIWYGTQMNVESLMYQRVWAVVGVTGERTFQTVSKDKGKNTTIVSYVSAGGGGVAMPPFIIFKAAKVKTEWREAAPSGYYLRRSESGYINAILFYESAEKFVEFLKEKKILVGQDRALLLLDLHRSHLFNLNFLEYMKANRVEVCSFPPHCTHCLQPLDDTPFGSFKIGYQKNLLRVNRILYGQKMSKATFFRAFVAAYSSVMTPEIIRKSWKNTGLMPFDRSVPNYS